MKPASLGDVLAVALGARLRHARIRRGLTAAEVAKRIGSHRPIVSRTERGRHTPTLDGIARHAAAVGLDLAAIGACIDEIAALYVAGMKGAPARRGPRLTLGVGALTDAPTPTERERHRAALARQRMHHAAEPVLEAWRRARRAA